MRVDFELRVNVPIGVFKKTMPAFVRQTDPRSVMAGSACVTGLGDAMVSLSTDAGGGSGSSSASATTTELANMMQAMRQK